MRRIEEKQYIPIRVVPQYQYNRAVIQLTHAYNKQRCEDDHSNTYASKFITHYWPQH